MEDMELVKMPLSRSGFSFQRLSLARLDLAVTLCGECVGKNLYSRDLLAAVVDAPYQQYYFLLTPEGETAGYIYFHAASLDSMAALSRIPRERLAVISEKKAPVIGNLRSIGVVKAYRHRGLSEELVRFYLERLQNDWSADTAFGVFWKPNGHIPMERTLTAFDFIHLGDSSRVWYDNDELICPVCGGRCRCDAAIYYKPIRKETTR